MSWIYLYGAKRDELSPVSKKAIRGLRIGSGWIDFGRSLFGQFKFPPYLPKEIVYIMQEVSHIE